VNAPASVQASTSFNTDIRVENQNTDIGQDFVIDYWITNNAETENYSSGQQTIYVASSGSSDLTATLISPSIAGDYRFRALVTWAGGTATAYDSFAVLSSTESKSESSRPSVTGSVVDSIVCNSPYIRYGKECCLDKNNNKICDIDDFDEKNRENVQNEKDETKENLSKEDINTEEISVRKIFSSKILNSLLWVFIVFIVVLAIAKINLKWKSELKNIITHIGAWFVDKVEEIRLSVGLKVVDPNRLTNIMGMKVYTSDGYKIGVVREVYLDDKNHKIYGWLIKVNRKIAGKIGKKFILVKHSLVFSIKQVVIIDERVSKYLENFNKG